MLSRTVGALRTAATLTHGLPTLRARVRLGDRVLLEIVPPDDEGNVVGASGDSPVMTPCAFRCAVGEAYRRHLGGEHLLFLGLPPASDPAIDIATLRSGAARPGGLYRVPLGDRSVWAFATTFPPVPGHELALDLIEQATAHQRVAYVGIHPDPVTEISLAWVETTAMPGSDDELQVIELVEALMARWTAHELLRAAYAGATS